MAAPSTRGIAVQNRAFRVDSSHHDVDGIGRSQLYTYDETLFGSFLDSYKKASFPPRHFFVSLFSKNLSYLQLNILHN